MTELSRDTMRRGFLHSRRLSEEICAPLTPEDHVIQAMPDVSPPKWHLAHTSWFYETFVLATYVPEYQPVHPTYAHLFNSYYQQVNAPFPRPRRGLLARPTTQEVLAYRTQIDERLLELIESLPAAAWPAVASLLELGINHEQQHQELLLMDIKYNYSINPLRPVYRDSEPPPASTSSALRWLPLGGGTYEIGHDGHGFAFDNEGPQHARVVTAFELASRPVTNGEYLAFITAGGYRDPQWWLADGWATVLSESWQAPLYWEQVDGDWQEFTLGGMRPLDHNTPVSHVSYFEADAYARFAGARLPSEFEWELAAQKDLESTGAKPQGHFLDSGRLHPRGPTSGGDPTQLFGDVWELTQSPYAPYPGFRPPSGAIGEYNGKFMCNQVVSRGGSCVTPNGHVRATYRNFFYPHQRWCFQGLRLAR